MVPEPRISNVVTGQKRNSDQRDSEILEVQDVPQEWALGYQGQEQRRFPPPRQEGWRRRPGSQAPQVLPSRRCQEASRQQAQGQAHKAHVPMVHADGTGRKMCWIVVFICLDSEKNLCFCVIIVWIQWLFIYLMVRLGIAFKWLKTFFMNQSLEKIQTFWNPQTFWLKAFSVIWKHFPSEF